MFFSGGWIDIAARGLQDSCDNKRVLLPLNCNGVANYDGDRCGAGVFVERAYQSWQKLVQPPDLYLDAAGAACHSRNPPKISLDQWHKTKGLRACSLMGGQPQRRKKVPTKNKAISKKYRTRRRPRDLDQIHDDLKKNHQPAIDLELPGLGMFPCVPCAQHFIRQDVLDGHVRSKQHKKRLRELKETPYSQEEANAAAGMGSYRLN